MKTAFAALMATLFCTSAHAISVVGLHVGGSMVDFSRPDAFNPALLAVGVIGLALVISWRMLKRQSSK